MAENPIDPGPASTPSFENEFEKLREKIFITTDFGRMTIDGIPPDLGDRAVVTDTLMFLATNLTATWDALIVAGAGLDDLRRRVEALEAR